MRSGLALAKDLGADLIINVQREDPARGVLEATDGTRSRYGRRVCGGRRLLQSVHEASAKGQDGSARPGSSASPSRWTWSWWR